MQGLLDPIQPKGRRLYWKFRLLPGVDVGSLDLGGGSAAAFDRPIRPFYLSMYLHGAVGGASRASGRRWERAL